jgi:hypothetical protein
MARQRLISEMETMKHIALKTQSPAFLGLCSKHFKCWIFRHSLTCFVAKLEHASNRSYGRVRCKRGRMREHNGHARNFRLEQPSVCGIPVSSMDFASGLLVVRIGNSNISETALSSYHWNRTLAFTERQSWS